MNPKYIITMHRGLIDKDPLKEIYRYWNIVIERDKRIIEALHYYNDVEKLFELNIIYPRYDFKLARFFEEEMIKKHLKLICKNIKVKLDQLKYGY